MGNILTSCKNRLSYNGHILIDMLDDKEPFLNNLNFYTFKSMKTKLLEIMSGYLLSLFTNKSKD
jgi:hypothetical protein